MIISAGRRTERGRSSAAPFKRSKSSFAASRHSVSDGLRTTDSPGASMSPRSKSSREMNGMSRPARFPNSHRPCNTCSEQIQFRPNRVEAWFIDGFLFGRGVPATFTDSGLDHLPSILGETHVDGPDFKCQFVIAHLQRH